MDVATASATWPPPLLDTAPVYEYYHAGFGHYFSTASPGEQHAIETGAIAGWSRVGPQRWWLGEETGYALDRFYGVWVQPGAGRVPLCRFFSAAFAPKSSHFFTAWPGECEAVRRNPHWTFEGVAGYVRLPAPEGSCDEGIPLYRYYNGGQSGAPNHRYVTGRYDRTAMDGRAGWVAEGATACVAWVRPDW